MADDSDVPPLEDMTSVLKQANAIRDGRELGSDAGKKSQREQAREKAKVTKKNVAGHAVKPQQFAARDSDSLQQIPNVSQAPKVESVPTLKSEPTKSINQEASKKSENNKGNVYGGLKKGFLFGSSNKTKPSSSTQQSNKSSQNAASVVTQNKSGGAAVKEDIPYIKANGKTESGLTLGEVQQAMTETKGLLDNQEWITDDLLSKVEGNDLLLKRFADPTFMKALEEFQTNPQAAMEKYKDNKEVEKFLLEFCGLLGDHFTHMGSSSDTSPSSQTSKTSSTLQKQTSSQSSTPSATSNTAHQKPEGPKIVELADDLISPTTAHNKLNGKPKIFEIFDKDTSSTISEKKSSDPPKIVEITDSDSLSDTKDIKLSTKTTKTKKSSTKIFTHNATHGADMTEVPSVSDDEVKKMLDDPKVMEVLMDPQIMSLIQVLRTDPEKAQRTVDTANPELKHKVKFLVSKGLLQFQG